MCLGHVYIVLEPVGSAHLTFADDIVLYELYDLVIDVVRSPGCDHGHDEEPRNGREVKIDTLEGYIRTQEWFRKVSGIFQSTKGLLEPPGKVNGPYGP